MGLPNATRASAGAVLWVGVFVSAVFSILVSVQNGILSLLYVGGREGNDERISRDTWLARQIFRFSGLLPFRVSHFCRVGVCLIGLLHGGP